VLTIEPGTIIDTEFRNTSGASTASKSSDATTSDVVVRETLEALESRLSTSRGLTSPVFIPGSDIVKARSRIATALMAIGGDLSRRFVLKTAAKRNLRLISK